MFGSASLLALASVAVAGFAPDHSNEIPFSHDNYAEHLLQGRGTLGPISTNSAANVAGGQVVCSTEPVGSFFVGLKPPVCNLK